MANPNKQGSVFRCTLDGTPLQYFAYLPVGGQQQGRVFVTIHGISRNAEEHLNGFRTMADHYGAVMIAPLFPQADFPSYQRLGPTSDKNRADFAFDRILQDANERLGVNSSPLHMFGFSGGGQFAHRYALFYPRRVASMVLGAPGWFTFPTPEEYYPFGLRSSSDWPRLKFSPTRFLKIPTLVLVGEEDDIRDEDLNKARRVDALQGLDRVERGERWVNAMRALARSYDISSDFRFETVANANHAYESYLSHLPFSERVFSFLFGPAS